MSSNFIRRLLLLAILPFTAQALELSWVGCGITRNAFMADLAAAYQQETGITINIAGGGATKGIRSIAAKEADIGGACRYSLVRNREEAGMNWYQEEDNNETIDFTDYFFLAGYRWDF